MPFLPQDIIHKLVAGGAARWFRVAFIVLGVLALAVAYNWRSFKNLATPAAMDQAQLARNLANGEGYTTRTVRPFTIFLLRQHNQSRLAELPEERRGDLAHLRSPHPDIVNAPGYPVLLAGWLKTQGVVLSVSENLRNRFNAVLWENGWHPQDFWIALLNQGLLFAAVGLTFLLARRLFDAPVAWTAAGLLLGAEILWRFSVSGLSTMLLLVLLLTLVWLLVRFEEECRVEPAPGSRLFLWVGLAGLVLGAGFLTRYSFGFLFIPALVYVLVLAGPRRIPAAALLTVVFAACVTPWLARNLAVCGAPLGTATYTLLENSVFFPQHRLERALHPDFTRVGVTPLWWKFFINGRAVVMEDLPRLGGTWITGFFLVGLLIGFRSPAIRRLRWWLVGALATLVFAQALTRTATATDFAEVHDENLLVLLLPLVVIFGVALFYILLDQMALPFLAARYAVIAAFCGVMTLPLLATFLPPRPSPFAYPPYEIGSLKTVSEWMQDGELIMTDVPWAVAWYGRRQAVLLTLDAEDEFYALNDFLKPVRALYLSPAALDARFLSQWVRPGGDRTWGVLIMSALTREQLPPRFPLRKSTRLPEQLFLADWERWIKPELPAR
jgi:predicted membrane protein